MQSAYSYYGSRLHLILEDEVADSFNRFQQAWFDAQTNHEATHGTRWDPSEPLLIDFEESDKLAWDNVGRIINLLIEVNGSGLELTEEEITDDFLVKL
jgi:hypothetical protein